MLYLVGRSENYCTMVQCFVSTTVLQIFSKTFFKLSNNSYVCDNIEHYYFIWLCTIGYYLLIVIFLYHVQPGISIVLSSAKILSYCGCTAIVIDLSFSLLVPIITFFSFLLL